MKYLLLIYHSEEAWNSLSEADQQAVFARHTAMREQCAGNGHFVTSAKLMDTNAATSIRRRGGDAVVLDGPFAETKEQLGGFYLLDCDSLDEAIGYAKLLTAGDDPTCVELRPVEYSPD